VSSFSWSQYLASATEEFGKEPERLLKDLIDQPQTLFNPHRLAIMLELYHTSAVEFAQLRHDLKLTDGALATHMKALVGDGFVESKREQIETRERTTFILTRSGASALVRFLDSISALRRGLKQ